MSTYHKPSDDTPRATLQTAAGITVKADDPDNEAAVKEAIEITETLDGYFSQFAEPVRREQKEQPLRRITGQTSCICCGSTLDGLLGTFSWALTHGEGMCAECGWPARAYHDPKDTNGKSLFTSPLNIICQYHPMEVMQGPVDRDDI